MLLKDSVIKYTWISLHVLIVFKWATMAFLSPMISTMTAFLAVMFHPPESCRLCVIFTKPSDLGVRKLACPLTCSQSSMNG